MLSPEKLARIKALAQQAKTGQLSPEEQAEQQQLREEYMQVFRQSMRQQIEGIKVVDPKGNDVTPEKLKQIQKAKGLHQR